MNRLLLSTGLVAAALAFAAVAHADDRHDGDDHRDGKMTIAVFGDWPYSQTLLNAAPLLLNSVNNDRDVSLVLHVGDIHSGSMACASAGILPPIPASNPGWNQQIYALFQQFKVPMVYTPGDNEWTDCHKSKQLSSGDPLKELASVRSLFFARPGKTLGVHERTVLSQAQFYDHAHPTDANYVENVMWEDSSVVFVTINMPGGSNNDASPWTGTFANPATQAQEMADRTAADIRWLQTAFKQAKETHARAILVATQADMWDPEQTAPGGAGLSNYTPFVQQLAELSLDFGRPVLLINGDSHLYEVDQPLANPSSTTGVIHHTLPVPNLTRITVQGSTNAPAEWLRLTIDPRTRTVFSWQNVVYCANPNGTCP